MVHWYGFDGSPITMEEWSRLFDDPSRLLKQETFPNGLYVSTVWLGLDHSLRGNPPLIFETMVFASSPGEELGMRRYATMAEALAGHEELVQEWTTKGETL
jgi:hypothetical protein